MKFLDQIKAFKDWADKLTFNMLLDFYYSSHNMTDGQIEWAEKQFDIIKNSPLEWYGSLNSEDRIQVQLNIQKHVKILQ